MDKGKPKVDNKDGVNKSKLETLFKLKCGKF